MRYRVLGIAAIALVGIGADTLWPTAATVPATRPTAAVARPAPTGEPRFVGIASTPLATAPGGPAFATLYVSAPVAVAGTEAGAAHITARLWMRGDAAALYSAPKGVEVGSLDAAVPGHAEPGAAIDGWTPVAIDGYLAAKAVVASLDPIWWAAKFDYEFVCADCHTPHAPAEYSAMQWGIFMARMAKYAKLLPDNEMVILKWLQTTASTSGVRH